MKPAELTARVDSVQACLSKGLGAPVGSVVAGPQGFVDEARRVRKMLGGGVRQGGVLAAAGLVALGRLDRLHEDHEAARELADGLAELGLRVRGPQTNIVPAEVDDLQSWLTRLRAAGVLASSMDGCVRFVTHRDVSRADIGAALRRTAEVAQG